MHKNSIQFAGDSLENSKITVKNVTGAALVAGGVYALDLTASDTDTSGATDVVRAVLGNIVGVLTANLAGVLVVLPKAIAAGEIGSAVLAGPVRCLVNGTTDIARGDRLKAANASNVLTKASAAVGSTDIGVAVALEAFTTNADGTIWVLFDGICFNKVINGAVS